MVNIENVGLVHSNQCQPFDKHLRIFKSEQTIAQFINLLTLSYLRKLYLYAVNKRADKIRPCVRQGVES